MATVGRESRFMMPTKQEPRAPPQVDTLAASTPDNMADRAYTGQDQLTPGSRSSGSQSSISPQTPSSLRPGLGKQDEYFAPKIASHSPPPPESTRPGGYGGLEDSNGREDPAAVGPKQPAPNLMDRLNTIPAGPFGSGRRPSAPAPNGSSLPVDAIERPSTSASNLGSSLGSGKGVHAPRLNGYGGLGPPSRGPEGAAEPPATPSRADTFPRGSGRFGPPPRTPTAPTPSATLRPDRLRSPLDSPASVDGRVPMTADRTRRPSRGPDTSRPPPPRTGIVRPKTPGVPKINLAEEFGIGNPYHTPSDSTSSNNSDNSSQPERRPSQASSRTSPPRSLSSRSGRKPSDTSGFDNLMSDIQASMNDMKPKPPAIAPLKLPPRDPYAKDRPSPLSSRPPRTGDRGYDPRIDPLVQNPRYAARGRSPLPSPALTAPLPEGLSVQTPSDILSPSTAGLPSPAPRFTSSPERMADTQQEHQQHPQQQQAHQHPAPEDPGADPKPARSQSQPRLQPREPPSIPQPPPPPTSTTTRGNCKACGLPIKGKSISSADGRLTGRYHKPCFVCSTCQEPFSSATFYVLDDKPYCELHYHRLNGSLCGSCGRGIEGQYLEDTESRVKHHVGCFKCAGCGMALRDGYFEVAGKAYCEKDAWRLVGGQQQPPWQGGNAAAAGGGPHRPPYMGGGPRGPPGAGGYNRSPLGPPGPRLRMEKRMTRLGMM
ncbi:hypothetical protein C8A03DRAFT_41241 [Achaetomium macrosporum]|uniref:LIM zinc-binding domain-containing protein n=1 Tax=Achaetomium macrosporum TaxID=79813 RepID=A0AAN7HGP8_9PEZI|nr:hypothetical protein C8A03DRAFT_41241 [Achaetomium macrosporum]